MKKILIIIAILFIIPMTAMAQAVVERTITFTWNQGSNDLPYLQKWVIAYSDTPGGPYTEGMIDVIYEGDGEIAHTSQESISYQDLQLTTRYWVVRAVDIYGRPSGWSEEFKHDMDLRPHPPGEPTEVVVTFEVVAIE